MKYLFPLFFLFIFISCDDGNDPNRTGRVVIPIVEMVVPETTEAYSQVSIDIQAIAPNGCHSDLVIEADLTEANRILFTATAFDNGNEMCPDVLVIEDSTFKFNIGANSEYIFQANEAPFDIIRDTTVITQ
ncbi:hypothetical protein [Mangrovivirga cuniculi]|nr:hypothetical protein [Mangrovivirga cuniculi]